MPNSYEYHVLLVIRNSAPVQSYGIAAQLPNQKKDPTHAAREVRAWLYDHQHLVTCGPDGWDLHPAVRARMDAYLRCQRAKVLGASVRRSEKSFAERLHTRRRVNQTNQ